MGGWDGAGAPEPQPELPYWASFAQVGGGEWMRLDREGMGMVRNTRRARLALLNTINQQLFLSEP